jgi:outer membrane protein TolC
VTRAARQAAIAILAAAASACATPTSPLEGPWRAIDDPHRGRLAGPGSDPTLPALARATEDGWAILQEARARGSLSLEDCVRLALATREELLSLDEDRLQALLLGDVAMSGLLPDVSLRAHHDRQDPVTINVGGSPQSTEPVRSEVLLTVFQPIFQGLREFHAMRAADRTAEAFTEDRRDLRRALSLSVARAFYLHAESEAEMRALEETLRFDEERVLEMEARAEQGLARRTEVLLQVSRRETTRADLVAARQRREGSRVVLEALTGAPIELPLSLRPDPPPSVPGREALVAEAFRNRADLRAADRRMEAAAAEVSEAGARRLPTVGAEANWFLDRWNHSQFAEETRWDLSLFMDFPLYTGGELDSRVRISSSRLRQRALERALVRRRIVEEVDRALVTLAAGLERLEALRANERFAKENLALLQEEYRQGLATNLEVFTAQQQVQEAVVALERQTYQSRLDAAEVDVAIGREDRIGVPRDDGAPPAKEKP